MTYELEMLNSLIFSDLDPSNFEDVNLSSDQFGSWISSIEKEATRIKNTFIEVAFGYQCERQIERYMQLHQRDLIRITDGLLSYLTNDEARRIRDQDKNLTLTNLYKNVYRYLEGLLTYLERHFSRFFDVEATIPNAYRIMAIRDFRERFLHLENALRSRRLSSQLIKIVLLPVKAFLTSGEVENNRNISFMQLMYLKIMLNELENPVFSDGESNDPEVELMYSMIYINFNSYKFFAWCTECIKSEYQQKETLSDQIDNLAWCSKILNQTQQKPSVAYKPERDSLKMALIAWIDEEISFLEKRHQLTLNMPMNKVEGLTNNFKLSTSLSVAQLAYFIRILLEEKILINRNQREVLKFIAQYTRTKKAENVSAESLRTRYYNVDTSTKEAVKEITIRLLNNIRKKA